MAVGSTRDVGTPRFARFLAFLLTDIRDEFLRAERTFITLTACLDSPVYKVP